jgi:hypothetical protein
MKHYSKIVNGKYGNIYKGHTLKVFNEDGKSLHFQNTYYNMNIHETYHTKHDMYNISIDKSLSSPKWLYNMLNQHPLKQTRIRIATDLFINDVEYTLIYKANEYYRELHLMSHHEKGLLFKQSYEHIILIKEVNSIWSFINKKLKNLNNTAFDTFCTFSDIDQSYILPSELFNFEIKKEKKENIVVNDDDLPF